MKYNPVFSALLLLIALVGNTQTAKPKKADVYSYTIIVLGKGNQPLYDAKIASLSGELRTNNQGEVKYENYLAIITVSAVGYFPQKIDLQNYPNGGIVTVKLTPRADEMTPLRVYVTDKSRAPIPNASVTVSPGRSAVTNASGMAKAYHNEQPGEYVVVRVSATGYKTQQQRVMVGAAQGNAITKPDDVAKFIMEKGENEINVTRIVVEVTDENSNEPVKGASVEMELYGYDARYSGTSNNQGEAVLEDNDYGFQGTTGRVKVNHPDYQEKWSDIPEELMTAKDNTNRRFVVFVKKKDDVSGKYNITWTDPYAVYKFQWEVRPAGAGYQVKHKMTSTTHSYNQKLIGQSWDDITLTPNGDGTFTMRRASVDTNPGNAGSFEQTATCTISGGSISCQGTHKGTALTHWIKIQGSKL